MAMALPVSRLHHHQEGIGAQTLLSLAPGVCWTHVSRSRIATFPCMQFPSYSGSNRMIVNATSASQDLAPVGPTSMELLAFTVGATMTPHQGKVEKGEDAYFVSSYGRVSLPLPMVSLGKMELFNAQMVPAKVHTATQSQPGDGSIVAILERNGIPHAASVGDCGLRILLQGRIVFATQPQLHCFDCPYRFSSGGKLDDITVIVGHVVKEHKYADEAMVDTRSYPIDAN